MFRKKVSYWCLSLAINIALAAIGAMAEVFITSVCTSFIELEVLTLILPIAFLLLFGFMLIKLNQMLLDWRFRYERETPSDASALISAMIGIGVMGFLMSQLTNAGKEFFQ